MRSQSPRRRDRATTEAAVACQPRACQICRVRKIKCDKAQPSCTSCTTHDRTCVYRYEQPRPRPSTAIIASLQKEIDALGEVLRQLKRAEPGQAAAILQDLDIAALTAKTSTTRPLITGDTSARPSQNGLPTSPPLTGAEEDQEDDADHASEAGFDPSNYVSVDDHGQMGIFGLTSTLHDHGKGEFSVRAPTVSAPEGIYQIIANAALERQKEFRVRLLPDIDGVPTNIASHLLDLHWNRQHHTFLLTYRPVLMRDLVNGGPYCSSLLLNAIFACASKYSDRIYLRDEPSDPLSAGGRFFRRCDELIAAELPFGRPSIPTVVAFLLLGSTFIARGDISKGWSYTGFAMRMVYDLGLHLDCRKPRTSLEEIEIRRRVFWGAFICDKLQSLYLGRPMAMNLHDNRCPADFMDTFEELDLWTPYVDPEQPSLAVSLPREPTPVYSVSTFQQLCNLSKLMTRIMNCFYSAGLSLSKAATHLRILTTELSAWRDQLPDHLLYEYRNKITPVPPPNVLNLHNTFHSLIILLNRPFVSDGHLRSRCPDTARSCWKACTASAKTISSIISGYRSAYTLRGAPYLTSYAAYVSCTIHVRNAALEKGNPEGEHSQLLMLSLRALDELSLPNPGVAKPASIIRRLMRKHGVEEPQCEKYPSSHEDSFFPETDHLTVVTQSPDADNLDFSFASKVSPQSMTLTSLFDTFMPSEGFKDLLGSAEVPQLDTEVWTNDILFGFMNGNATDLQDTAMDSHDNIQDNMHDSSY